MTSGSAAVPNATASVKTPTKRGKATSILRFLVGARRQRRIDSSRAKLFRPNGLSARAPTTCFGLPPRAGCDPDTTDKHFQLQVLPGPLQFSAHGLRKIAQIASGHRLYLISFAG